jgi:hypothetical protein
MHGMCIVFEPDGLIAYELGDAKLSSILIFLSIEWR